MKKGDTINRYTILQDFTTAGGGLSKWTFAKKDDTEYFIKEFLSPTYPVDGSPGGTKIKEEKRRQCEIFEEHHEGLMAVLADKHSEGGNLVVTRYFFREGPKYYKVTDKVDVASLQVEDIVEQPPEKRTLILITVAHSLGILHQANIVHGDLKPANILIKETITGDYTTKLIDFDNSYFSGKPPSALEEVVGDMVYYSPELGRYIQGDKHIKPEDLQVKSDIFALGLIYCQYLTGGLPDFDQDEFKYPYAAVCDGIQLTVNGKGLPPKLASVVDNMLLENPIERPDIQNVFRQLKQKDLLTPEPPKPVRPEITGGKLTGKLTSSSKGPTSDTTLPKRAPKKPEKPGLRGTLIKSKKD